MAISKDYLSDGSPTRYDTVVFGPAASPEALATLDLSGVIGARFAYVKLAIDATADMDATSIQADDDNNNYWHAAAEAAAYGLQLGHHEATVKLVLECFTSSAGKIKWKTEASQTATVILLSAL